MIYLISTVLLVAAAVQAAPAATPKAQGVLSRSVSGQFLVHGEGPQLSSEVLATNAGMVRLAPSLLTISCERLKQELWKELGNTAPWRGKVHLTLYRATTGKDQIGIRSERFNDGWQYWVVLPDIVERDRLVRTMTEVLLLEIANREGGARSAEIPPWLVEGLAQELLASSAMRIILPPPQLNVNGLMISTNFVEARRDHPLDRAHKVLRQNQPLTFQELSWPKEEDLCGPTAEVFQASAQVFAHSLLRLEEGRACLRAMLADLPQRLNWQFAFLNGYRAHFKRPLDVEKWWALRAAHFTGRDLGETWSPEESWKKLGQSLRSRVQVRTGANELPLQSDVTLQTIIRDWEPALQTEALQNKLHELQMLRLRLFRDFAPLTDAYCQTLTIYLEERTRTGLFRALRKPAIIQKLKAETIRELDALDAQREAMRPEEKPEIPAQASTSAAVP